MHLKLVISFALCHFVWGRPSLYEDYELQNAISNLQLLIPLLIKDSQALQHTGLNYPVPKARDYDSKQSEFFPPPVPKALQPKAQKVYPLDGAFTDIPAGAFKLEHRKELKFRDGNEGRVVKKDLSRPIHKHVPAHTPEHKKIAETLIQTCLKNFQGKSQPKLGSVEITLNICKKIFDIVGIDSFAIDDEKSQKSDESSTVSDESHQHLDVPKGSVICECCPNGHHQVKTSKVDERNDDDETNIDSYMDDIFQLPTGQGWRLIKSINTDKK